MKQQATLIFLLVVVCLACASLAQAASLATPTLDDLDQVIKHSSFYTHEYERQIDLLKVRYSQAKTDQERLSISRDLYSKCKPFKLDLAYIYAEEKLALAVKLHSKEDSVFSELDKAGILTKTGNYVEANRILSGMQPRQMSVPIRQYYFSLYGSLYEALGEASIAPYLKHRYEKARQCFRDSLRSLKVNQSVWDKAEFLRSRHLYTEALQILSSSYKQLSPENREMGYVAFAISDIYHQLGDIDKEKQYLIISAISDLKNSVKEYVSLRRLASLLYEEGDVRRAYVYMKKSLDDATFCNARLRIIEVSDALPIIDKAYDEMQTTERIYIWCGFIVFSVLLILLAVMVVFTRRQLRKIALARLALEETNASLFESNKIKNVYIMEFMNKCSAYIDKLDNYRRSLNKLAVAGKMQELYKRLKSNELMNDEIDEFFEDFDRIFLKIFPNFVVAFNALLKENESVLPKKPGRLNTELRIFALMRLGIVENKKIAAFLRCSQQTVYSYRSRIRLRSFHPDDFEQKVLKIE